MLVVFSEMQCNTWVWFLYLLERARTYNFAQLRSLGNAFCHFDTRSILKNYAYKLTLNFIDFSNLQFVKITRAMQMLVQRKLQLRITVRTKRIL